MHSKVTDLVEVTTMKSILISSLAAFSATIALATGAIAQQVPNLVNMPYSQARVILARQGWQFPAWIDGSDVGSGTESLLADQTYHEVLTCAGTGTAPCIFEFVNSDGSRRLTVNTAGENLIVRNWTIRPNTNGSFNSLTNVCPGTTQEPDNPEAMNGRIAGNGVNLRSSPYSYSQVVEQLSNNSNVHIYTWRKVGDYNWAWVNTENNDYGWVREPYIKCR